ncbi:MAG: quinone oxidoreductase [Actinomycetota bacterium]|nr:quinone oxidoreductase [Actinomycetota bacterium]
MRAILVRGQGGPEVLREEQVEIPEPGDGQARVHVQAAGVNFIDVYQRDGRYPVELPMTPGLEAAGVVDAVGAGVDEVGEGDRVAYAGQPGAYAEYAVVPAARLVPVPDELELRVAAAVMLQGMTAHYLSSDTFPLRPGHVALVHAGSGGVGRLLVQLAARRGARVITTVSTEDKEALARQAGATDVIRYTEMDFAEEVERLTDGGVDVVYDSVGKDTFGRSLDCLRPRGLLALYGQSSGPVDPVDPQTLNAKGSLFLTRPALAHHTAGRDELLGRAQDLFEWIASGELDVRIDRTWPLAEAPEAHRYLQARQTRGKLLLVP